MWRSLSIALAALLALDPWHGATSAGPKVVASIKPVHSLVAGVMQGVGEPFLLVKGARSPHDYAMKPSEARALDEADLVFWIGPGLETFLERPINALAADAIAVSLSLVPGVELLKNREGGAWEAHAHEVAASNDDHGEHTDHDEHGEHNMHVWLDPVNAAAMVDAIAGALAGQDAANAGRYGANAAALKARLAALDGELKASLAPIAGRPYIVLHDAYPNFEKRYRLAAVGSITVSPTRPPSAQRVSEIRRKIKELDAACVFTEPQSGAGIVDTVIEGTSARKGELDPLGAALADGPELYFALLRGNAAALRQCLLAGA
jgi:zinc transport system substrate-binding protein